MNHTIGLAGLLFALLPAAAADTIAPKAVSMAVEKAPLKQVLAEITKQTGLVVDSEAIDATVTITARDRPFWRVLEDVAQQTGTKINVTAKGEKLALLKAAHKTDVQAFIDGPFRFVAKEILARKDLDTGAVYYELKVDMHWEPHFPVFRASGLNAKANTDTKSALSITADSGKAPVAGHIHTFNVRVTGVTRAVNSIDIEGSIILTAADKILRFTFDDITKFPANKTIDNVAVALQKMNSEDKVWEAKVGLTYPQNMPEFESYETYFSRNKCRVFNNNKSYEYTDYEPPANVLKPVFIYRFQENAKTGLLPGPGWGLEVETPSPLKEVKVAWEFKGIKLP